MRANTITHDDLELGMVVRYGSFGIRGRATRLVRIDDVSQDIKDGRPGFGGTLVEGTGDGELGDEVWGYTSQVKALLPKHPEADL